MDKSQVKLKKPLSFADFIGSIVSFVARHKNMVFFGAPTLFNCIWFPIVFSIYGIPKDPKDLWGGILFPFGISAAIYMCFFTDTGDHAAKGNEQMTGCALIIVLVPILGFAYIIYRLIHLAINLGRGMLGRSEVNTVEERVEKLNHLLAQGLINQKNYDKQLSKILEK